MVWYGMVHVGGAHGAEIKGPGWAPNCDKIT